MNAIELRERIDNLIDRTRSARHSDVEYYNSINAATVLIVKDRVAPLKVAKSYSVQSAQRVRDELYTLVPAPLIAAPTGDDIIRFADYYYFLLFYAIIDGFVKYCRSTAYNQVGLLGRNPFKKPSSVKPYYNEFATGIKVIYGTGTFTSSELWYVKNPAIVSIGTNNNKIIAGGALTNTVNYIVYEQSVYNSVTYYPGQTIAGTGAALTSGIVILLATIVNSDLPVNLHEELCIKSASILQGSVEDYGKKQDLLMDAEKS